MDLATARSIIWTEMKEHKLFNLGWSFRWDNAKTRCGQCRFADRTISLSKSYVSINEESEVRDTILHEIAHALVGPGHHHDITWKLKAQSIGARPLRCSTSDAQVQGKYIGRCIGCGVEVHRYRKPKFMNVAGFYSHIDCKRMGKESKIEWRRS